METWPRGGLRSAPFSSARLQVLDEVVDVPADADALCPGEFRDFLFVCGVYGESEIYDPVGVVPRPSCVQADLVAVSLLYGCFHVVMICIMVCYNSVIIPENICFNRNSSYLCGENVIIKVPREGCYPPKAILLRVGLPDSESYQTPEESE